MRVELNCTHPLTRLDECTRKKSFSYEGRNLILSYLRCFPSKSYFLREMIENFTEIVQSSETETEALDKIRELVLNHMHMVVDR